MQNPWLSLPRVDPNELTLPEDRPFLRAHEATNTAPEYRVHRNLYPEPFLGRFDAPVVFLLQNPSVRPSWIEAELRYQRNPAFAAARYSSFSGDKAHFYLSRPATCDAPGTTWWRKTSCQHVLPLVRDIANRLLVLEFMPYHSESFDHAHLRLPSQEFTFHLLRQAIARGALVLCARMWPQWVCAVPDLWEHREAGNVLMNNSRHPAITRQNTPGFDKLVAALND